MAVYTVSLNFLENLQPQEISYLGCILFCFTNEQNDCKMAVDKDGIILGKYRDVRKFPEIIKSWLDMLSYIPSSVERVGVDISGMSDSAEMCLALCSATNGSKKLIVYSMSSMTEQVDGENCVEYSGHKIKCIDKDEAKRELNVANVVNIMDSQYAEGNIIGSLNKNKHG